MASGSSNTNFDQGDDSQEVYVSSSGGRRAEEFAHQGQGQQKDRSNEEKPWWMELPGAIQSDPVQEKLYDQANHPDWRGYDRVSLSDEEGDEEPDYEYQNRGGFYETPVPEAVVAARVGGVVLPFNPNMNPGERQKSPPVERQPTATASQSSSTTFFSLTFSRIKKAFSSPSLPNGL